MAIRHQQISSTLQKHSTAVVLGCTLALFGSAAALAQTSSSGTSKSPGAISSPGSSSTMPPAQSSGSGAAPATGATGANGAVGATSPAPARQPPSDQEIAAQFKAADTNGDGKISKEEAKTGMPGLYRNFDRVDTKGAGFVTQDDLTVALKR